MKFETHVQDWEALAKDPLWAVLTEKRGWSVDEFFATGEADVQALMASVAALGFPRERIRVLDFGCGVGRLTRQLSKHFQECWGVDVSRQMLELAAKYNPSSHFHLNQRTDLQDFPSNHFDLIYSLIVLQHQPDAKVIAAYLREFMRVLRPQGLLAFQLPSRMPLRYRLGPRRRAYKLLHTAGFEPERLLRWKLCPMTMTAVDPSDVESILTAAGGHLLKTEPHDGSRPIPSMMYYVTKPSPHH
jgi:2-polyprenyl-3-methyl-5-hydroxy-6-metoxy-1,4-benzoquinol methylase